MAFSPLEERGYQGDLTLEAQIWSAVTGKTMSMAEFDLEGARFYTIMRCLTLRKYGSIQMRTLHDRLPAWAYGATITSSTDTVADWETSLDLYYDAWGYDRATGAPKQSTMAALGLSDISASLASAGLTLPA
jgi:aldehyde:ferredoxin oxidoreductase